MNGVLAVVASLAVALVLGLVTAGWVIYRPPFRPVIRNGPWMTNLKVGSADAGMYLRAHIALTGLFALNKSEVVYYRASTDDDGAPLEAGRDYVVEGRDIPARWWTLVLYGDDNHLIPNEAERHSFSAGSVAREADGTFRIRLGRTASPGNWLPSGDRDQRLSFSLKAYNPEPGVYNDPRTVRLPSIKRVSL